MATGTVVAATTRHDKSGAVTLAHPSVAGEMRCRHRRGNAAVRRAATRGERAAVAAGRREGHRLRDRHDLAAPEAVWSGGEGGELTMAEGRKGGQRMLLLLWWHWSITGSRFRG